MVPSVIKKREKAGISDACTHAQPGHQNRDSDTARVVDKTGVPSGFTDPRDGSGSSSSTEEARTILVTGAVGPKPDLTSHAFQKPKKATNQTALLGQVSIPETQTFHCKPMVVTPEPGVKLYHIWDARTAQPVFHTHQREVRLAKRVLPQIRP